MKLNDHKKILKAAAEVDKAWAIGKVKNLLFEAGSPEERVLSEIDGLTIADIAAMWEAVCWCNGSMSETVALAVGAAMAGNYKLASEILGN